MSKHIQLLLIATGLFLGSQKASATDIEQQATPVNYDQQVASSWTQQMPREYYSVRLGLTAPVLFIDTKLDPSRHAQAGMQLGFAYGYRLSDEYPIYVEPGIFYVSKGYTINANTNPANYQKKMSIRMHTFEIPVVCKYRIETMFDDFTVDPFLGGFISLGLAGDTKYFGDSYDPSRRKENTFRSEGFSSLDAGLRLGCGMTFMQFYAEIAYDWGMTNVARSNMQDFQYDDFDDSINTGCFFFTIGVNF
ncbi:MAG: PorT family protein [Bacteroidaceae bacterium]|nr:PorT family protein [Bacteroidaceae bacterium]